jgi:type IV pilus assembly protein PilX
MLHSLSKQSGAVLMVSMIMLLLLSIIGVTGSQVTSLEEKMAGNSYDQNIAFQSAEEALRSAEQVINAPGFNITTFDGTNNATGRFSPTDRPDYTNANTWVNTSAQAANVIPLVATQPRYFIHYIGNQPSDPLDPSSIPISMFRIVARGTGRQDTTRVFLQAYFGK